MPRRQALAKATFHRMRGNQMRAAAAGAEKAAAMHGRMAEGVKQQAIQRAKKDPTYN